MTDVALSIMALIAGGLTLELFASFSLTNNKTEIIEDAGYSLDEVPIGNPS